MTTREMSCAGVQRIERSFFQVEFPGHGSAAPSIVAAAGWQAATTAPWRAHAAACRGRRGAGRAHPASQSSSAVMIFVELAVVKALVAERFRRGHRGRSVVRLRQGSPASTRHHRSASESMSSIHLSLPPRNSSSNSPSRVPLLGLYRQVRRLDIFREFGSHRCPRAWSSDGLRRSSSGLV